MPSQKIIGIDFSDYSIELLSLARGFGKPKLHAYSRCVLPKGVLFDGVIQRPDILAEILKKMMRGANPHSLKSGICCFSLPDSQVFIHEFIMPNSLRGAALRQAILHEMHEKLPFKPGSMYFDYIVTGRNKAFEQILLFAAPDYVVEKYITVLLDSGMTTIAIDVESASIGRSLLDESDRHKITLIADIGARYANISIYDNFCIVGAHVFKQGGDVITQRISDEMKIDKNFAEEEKKKKGLEFSYDNLAVTEIIADSMKEVIRGMKEIVQYYFYRKQKIVENIILTGGTALMPGIQKFFQSHFWQDIEIRNPLKKLRLGEGDLKNGRKFLFSNVIGLALRGLHSYPHLEGVNLLQKGKSIK